MLKHCICVLIFFPCVVFTGQLQLSISAESAILINAETGTVLYEKEADLIQYPASITKMATCFFALHALENRLEDVVSAENESIVTITKEAKRRSLYSVPSWWLEVNSSHIGIKKDEELKVEDLLYGMMVASGNDAANVIAQHVGGTIPAFLEEMNRFLKNMGCENTYFLNPHGLHHPKHVTTARDIALLAKEAMKNSYFKQIVKTVRYTRPKTNKQPPTILVQTNKLLRKGKFYYPKTIGIKTGYTSDAQNTLVAAAEHEGRTLIAVLLKSKERDDIFKDAKKMFEAAFSQPKLEKVLIKGGPQKQKIRVTGGVKLLTAYVEKDICLQFYPAEEPELKCLLHVDEIKVPLQKGDRIGEIHLVDKKEKVIKSFAVYSYEDVQATWAHRIKEVLFPKENKKYKKNSEIHWRSYFLSICLIMGLLCFLFFYKRDSVEEKKKLF